MRIYESPIIRAHESAIERNPRQTLPTMRDIMAVLFRQRWPVLAAFVAVVIAVAVSGIWIPKYEAQMKIIAVRQRSDAMVTTSAVAPVQFSNDQVSEEDLDSEVELLNSDDVLRKVVMTTGLAGESGSSTDANSAGRVEAAARRLGNNLKIQPLPKSDVISVSYQARDPEAAAKVLKALAAAYMEKHLEVHRPPGELKFFNQQTEQYEQGLSQAQAKLEDFTKGTGVVSAQLERDSALRQADQFDSTARQAETTVLESEERVRVLQVDLQSMKPRMTTVVHTSDNAVLLEQLKSTLLNLELKRTDLLTKYEPTYPLVQEVNQQISQAKSAISTEESKPMSDESTDQDPNYQWVRGELTKAQADLSALKARSASAASIAKQYHQEAERLGQNEIVQDNLLSSEKTEETNYLLYVQKREEARISDALDQRGILNVSLAEQPVVPAIPKRSPLGVVFLTLLLAGTFSLTTAFVLDLMDPTFRTPDELAGYLGTPVLAALPKGGG